MNHSINSIEKINDKKRINFTLLNKEYSFNSYLIGNIQIKNLLFAVLAAYLSGIKIDTILKNINNRTYQIKNAIEWQQFIRGYSD